MCSKISEKTDFFGRIDKLCESKETVEIIAHDREITGKITEIGNDYIGITFEVEKEITKHVPAEDGETVAENQRTVIELETFIRFVDIKSISRIKNQAVR